ncbi:MAG: hypothetical protein LBM18_04085 [Oscillospiraceae bacterium]|nr:hypothetical protein [Oscillospiraceae bacterium]
MKKLETIKVGVRERSNFFCGKKFKNFSTIFLTGGGAFSERIVFNKRLQHNLLVRVKILGKTL